MAVLVLAAVACKQTHFYIACNACVFVLACCAAEIYNVLYSSQYFFSANGLSLDNSSLALFAVCPYKKMVIIFAD